MAAYRYPTGYHWIAANKCPAINSISQSIGAKKKRTNKNNSKTKACRQTASCAAKLCNNSQTCNFQHSSAVQCSKFSWNQIKSNRIDLTKSKLTIYWWMCIRLVGRWAVGICSSQRHITVPAAVSSLLLLLYALCTTTIFSLSKYQKTI